MWLVLCLGSHKADSKGMAWLSHILGALGRNLLPSTFRVLAKFGSLWVEDWGPLSLLAITWGFSEQFRAVGIPSHVVASNIKPAKAHQIPLML